jgi:glycosyltransferase involved in cell wall biosynthesis
MNMFFDARWIRTDFHDGISRYTAGLVQGLKDNNFPVTYLIHSKEQLKMLPSGIKYIIINNPISIKEFFIAYKLNKLGADVVFSPMQVMGFMGRKYKLILTLQDIIYYRHPKPPTFLPQHIRIIWRLFHITKWPQRLLLNRADFVSTVSKTSKKFISEFGLTDREIGVVYNASSLNLTKKNNNKRTKNIVYMGSFMPYKNVEVLINGMAHLPNDFTLHLLSKISAERKSELEQLIKPGVKVKFHNGISDADYIKLLQNAYCLATGSKEEGFGLPIIEAQQLGTPVICSEMEIFREVAGKGALYFKSDSPKQFAALVLKLNDQKLTSELIKHGFEQAAKFSWAKSARTLYNYCQKL